MALRTFQFRQVPDLPALAWLAAIEQGSSTVAVRHGDLVETRGDFFIEGCWSGDFARGELGSADCLFGTGGQVRGDETIFVPSMATTDPIYYQASGGRACVANSLPLLLSHLGDELDPRCTEYARINESLPKGFRDYTSTIPTRKGSVERLIHRNLVFAGIEPRLVDKPEPPAFATYADYRAYLRDRLGPLFANARDPARTRPLRVYSTQSKGYDSTAVNALASEFGVDAAFTIKQSKSNERSAKNDAAHQSDDDGEPVCNALGIPAIALDRRAFERGVPWEAFYWAGMHKASDINLCGMMPHIVPPALLLTGILGEMWYGRNRARSPTLHDGLAHWDVVGHGLAEVRLKVGFIQVPLAFIGGRRRLDLVRIADSEEMEPWRLGVAYDRAVPRRIAEEAGVPRGLFGQTKAASTLEFPTPNLPLDEELRRECLAYMESHGPLPRWKAALLPLVHAYNNFVRYSERRQTTSAYYLRRAVSTLTGARRNKLRPVWRHLDGCVYCFAVNKIASDLRARRPGERIL